jgi:hypothetical protein
VSSEKAGVGGSTPSLATTFQKVYRRRAEISNPRSNPRFAVPTHGLSLNLLRERVNPVAQ